MKLSAPSLLAGVMLSSLFGVANAGEPEVQVEAPPILASISVSGYQLLDKPEMAGIVGTLIPNGTYNVFNAGNGATIARGTATISSVPGQSGIYIVNYTEPSTSTVPERNSFVATGLEQGNAFGVVWDAGAQTTGLALYTLGSNGQLTGQWVLRNAAGSVTSQTVETLVPTGATR